MEKTIDNAEFERMKAKIRNGNIIINDLRQKCDLKEEKMLKAIKQLEKMLEDEDLDQVVKIQVNLVLKTLRSA